MNKKERETFKRDKIRYLWTAKHMSIRDMADYLNNDAEFVRKCGKISHPTVQYWLKKIKAEYENFIDEDAMEKFTAEFVRSVEFQDNEISTITKILEDPELKPSDRLAFLNLRHRIEIDKMTLLSDRALPLTVKKYKADRKKIIQHLKPVEEERPPLKWPEETREVN